MEFLPHLKCPVSGNILSQISKDQFAAYNIPEKLGEFGSLTNGLVDESKSYFYPIYNDIIILHKHYALFIGEGENQKTELSFDKKRVFDYYNEVNYKVKDSLKIYEDSPKWVDFREVSSAYIKNAFTRASKYYPETGKYLLDIASGPIGLPEYMDLANGYEYRICADISVNALIQAKINIEKAGKKGIFICGDITNIPIQDNVCDVVLSQHTLYHIPKDEQKTAVNEMYRVAKSNSKVVIVYSWFHHSWFMNITLNLVQLYRIARHIAGKIYVKVFNSKPRLYFYPHSRQWFKNSFEFSDEIDFFCWRSVNKYFLNIYIHPFLGGKFILNRLMRFEDKHPRFMGRFGDYPVIVISKGDH